MGKPLPPAQTINAWNLQPLLSGGNGGINQSNGGPMMFAQAQCVDTVRYPLGKATGLSTVAPIQNGSFTSLSQWYPRPAPISVTGFEFWAYVDAATSATVTLTGSIFLADPLGLPTGAALASGTITVDSNKYGFNLVLLKKKLSFAVPANPLADYCLTVTSTSNTPVMVLLNDANNFDGLAEDLSGIFVPGSGWISLFAAGADADWLLHPFVIYNLTPSFNIDQTPTCPTVPVDFTFTGTPWSQSKFYNINAFLNVPELSYTWNYGDGTPVGNFINPTHTYSGVGSFIVNLKDTVQMWTGTCKDQTSKTVVVNSGFAPGTAFSNTAAGTTVTFTDMTSNNPSQWAWDFGDGAGTSTVKNPVYTYATNGAYTVCLDATNACGTITVCQTVIVGSLPVSSCDTLTNAFGTATLYSDAAGGFVGGQNSIGTNQVAEKFTYTGNFGVGEIRFLFGAKEGANGVVATIWEDDGANGSPGTIVGQVPVPYSAIDTAGGLTVAVFNPAINVNGDFFAGYVLSAVAGDTVGLISNADGQTIPATAWERSGGSWKTTSINWGLEISWALDVVEKVSSNFNFLVSNMLATFASGTVGANGWSWNFGDGTSSTQKNPQHTYTANGTYNVCLTAMNSTCNATTCKLVTICPVPAAAFAFVPGGLTVAFQDISTFTPTTWLWSFGDGNTSTLKNPVHSYTANGSYTVCLIASSSCGADTICQPVNTNCTAPTAAFSYTTNNKSATFTDISASSQAWLWTFGDGNTSSSQNPNHTYATTGTYQVCLTVQDSCGVDSSCQMVAITCPLPVPAWTNSTNNLTVTFTNFSSGSPTTYLWLFGDGNTSSQLSPVHTYATIQTYTVCLIVGNACGSDTLCKPVPTGCTTPGTAFTYTSSGLSMTFTDASTQTPGTWLWDFGDGNTSALQNPGHSYTNQGSYTVCLTATNACGSDSVCQIVSIVCPQPISGFVYIKNQLSVNFVDQSQGSPSSWVWDFGDGTATSLLQNPTHAFAAPGTYTVCLIVADTCGPDTSCQTVTVTCPVPVTNFSFAGSGLSVAFTDLTVGATGWTWTFGDGNVSTTQHPTHNYSIAGTYTVCLIGATICGADTLCQAVNVICPLPQTNFTVSTNNYTATFTDNTPGNPISWSWDFGDGNFNVIQNPTHTYGNTGIFNVCLTVSDSCGSKQTCQFVTITCPVPVAGFTSSQNELIATFTDTSLNNPANHTWDFGDGNSSNQQNPVHTYLTPGTYQICLTVNTVCGFDQVCQTIIVTCIPPVPVFTFVTIGNTINFADLSTLNPTSWEWDFGDGNSSTSQNPSNSYASVGTFNVCLKVSSMCGEDSLCQQVVITCIPPTSAYNSSVQDSIANFQNLASANAIAWTWDFGDGTTSIFQNPPPHTYKAAGTYTVCLYVSNTCGIDTFCNQVTITCVMPTSAFTISSAGAVATFNDLSIIPQKWKWEFGDGDTSNVQNPTHAYSASGSYLACLTVTNFCGTNKSCQTVIVNCIIPIPVFATAQGGGLVNFTDNSSNNPTSWLWDFGDGATDTVQNPSHGYIFQGIFLVCLKAINSCGSSDSCMNVLVTQIGVDDEFGGGFHVWPNPTSGIVTIAGFAIDNSPVVFEVSDMLGQLLLTSSLESASGQFKMNLDLGEFAAGIYTIGIRSGTKEPVYRKVIRE